jgi:hypothetical protein
MKLVQPAEVKLGEVKVLCRQSRLVNTLRYMSFIVILLLPLLWWYLGAPRYIWIPLGVLAIIFTPMLLAQIFALWRASNWILVVQPDGLWLNIRVCSNDHLPEGRTVAWIDRAEIAGMGKYVATYTTPGSGETSSTTHWKTTSLQIELNHADTRELDDALLAEQNIKMPSRKVIGFIRRTPGKTGSYPVTLPQPNVIRIKWRSSKDFVSPSIKAVLTEMGLREKIDGGMKDEFGDWRTMDEGRFDELVRNLSASGDTFSAAELLVARRGLSLTEAMGYMDHLGKE